MLLDKAISKVLEDGARTKDISNTDEFISTKEMGNKVIQCLDVLNKE